MSNPGEMYVSILDGAVDASSPEFAGWFQSALDMWMGGSSDMRQQFFYDLLASNPDAWADWIHECIFPPGERPSDTTEIIPEPEDSEEEEDGRGEHERPGREWPDEGPPGGGGLPGTWPEFPEQEWPDGGPPSVRTPRVTDKREQQAHGAHRRPGKAYWNPDALIAGVVDPPDIDSPGGERPPPEYGKWRPHRPVIQPETVPDFGRGHHQHDRNSSFGQNFEHPLDPEAWDRHGLGFLRSFTPAAIEEWLMNNYNRDRRQEQYLDDPSESIVEEMIQEYQLGQGFWERLNRAQEDADIKFTPFHALSNRNAFNQLRDQIKVFDPDLFSHMINPDSGFTSGNATFVDYNSEDDMANAPELFRRYGLQTHPEMPWIVSTLGQGRIDREGDIASQLWDRAIASLGSQDTVI